MRLCDCDQRNRQPRPQDTRLHHRRCQKSDPEFSGSQLMRIQLRRQILMPNRYDAGNHQACKECGSGMFSSADSNYVRTPQACAELNLMDGFGGHIAILVCNKACLKTSICEFCPSANLLKQCCTESNFVCSTHGISSSFLVYLCP